MTKPPTAVPTTLNAYLASSAKAPTLDLASYTELGATLVTPEAIASLRDLLGPLREKTAALENAERLKTRLEILTTYFEETLGSGSAWLETRREVAFALYYFLKGFDRIPDSIPEIGLLDDALIVDTVLQRHVVVLQAHWKRRGRSWTG